MHEATLRVPALEDGEASANFFGNLAAQNRIYLQQVESRGAKKEFIEHVDRILGVARKYLTIHYLGRSSGFAEFASAVNLIKSRDISEITESELDLLCAVGLYGMARVRLEQVGLIVNMRHAIQYLVETATLYNHHLQAKECTGLAFDADQPWWEVAAKLPELRSRIDRYFYRLAQIDGSNWSRSELLMDRAHLDPTRIPETLEDILHTEVPEFQHSKEQNISDDLRRTTAQLLRAEGSPLRLLGAVMRAASEDPLTYSDYSTLLFPRGTKLTEPWTTTYEDFAAHVVFRSGFTPPDGQGIGDFQMIQKAMLAHHAAKKARNASAYLVKYGPNAKPSLSDDLGELGMYYNESAHHKGHMICGVRSAMRFLMGIEMQTHSGRLRVEGLTDFRLTRVSNAENDRYRIDQYPMFYCYGSWIRTVVESSLEAGYIFPRTLAN